MHFSLKLHPFAFHSSRCYAHMQKRYLCISLVDFTIPINYCLSELKKKKKNRRANVTFSSPQLKISIILKDPMLAWLKSDQLKVLQSPSQEKRKNLSRLRPYAVILMNAFLIQTHLEIDRNRAS